MPAADVLKLSYMDDEEPVKEGLYRFLVRYVPADSTWSGQHEYTVCYFRAKDVILSGGTAVNYSVLVNNTWNHMPQGVGVSVLGWILEVYIWGRWVEIWES